RGEALAALAEPSEPRPPSNEPAAAPSSDPAPAQPGEVVAGRTGPFQGPVSNVGALAIRIVAALDPLDRDLAKLRAPTPALREGLSRLQAAREELEAGR